MTNTELKKLIEHALGNGTEAIVNSDDHIHFEAVVISPLFNNMPSKVKQQQSVYAALSEHISSGEVHALSLKTYTPKTWQNINQSNSNNS